MADDTILKYPAGAEDGDTIRTLDDGTRKWAVGVGAYVTTLGTPDVLEIPVAAPLADNMANPTTLPQGACLLVFDGATWDRARGDSTNGLVVQGPLTNAQLRAAAVDVAVSGVVDVVPASPSAASYLPVRLTDGTSFYSASGGGGGGGQQYAEDAAHATGDLGTVALAVRKDTAAALAGTDGDYSVLITDSLGRLHVNVGNTVAVSAASLPLPTGAATAAKQPALGTAGTASADVLTIQGIASMVAVKVDGSGVTQPVSDAGGSLTVDAPVGTPVFVRLSDGTSAIATLPVSLASVPSHAVTNAGTFAVQVSAALPAGTNNIGDVDVLTLPALPAGTNLIGRTSASPETSTVYAGTTALTPKFALINASASGNTSVVPLVATKKIRVLQYRLQAAGDVDFKFRSSTAGDLTGAMSTGAKGGGGGAAYCPVGLFETAAGEALQINLSAAVQVSGHLVYIEV